MRCLLIRLLTVQQYNQLRSEGGRQIIYLIYTKLVFFWKLIVSHFETTKTFQVVSMSLREKSVDSCRNRSAGKYTAYLRIQQSIVLWGSFACQAGAKFGYLCKLIVNKWSSLKGAFSSGASERKIQKDDFNCHFWFKSCKSKVTLNVAQGIFLCGVRYRLTAFLERYTCTPHVLAHKAWSKLTFSAFRSSPPRSTLAFSGQRITLTSLTTWAIQLASGTILVTTVWI